MSGTKEHTCLFCGTDYPKQDVIHGASGAICRGCVFALGARLAEAERNAGVTGDPTKAIDLDAMDNADKPLETNREPSAHDYQNRIDLAAAYLEMGRRTAAVKELIAALESALLVEDYPTALRCVRRARQAADGPALRDKIVEILTRAASSDEKG